VIKFRDIANFAALGLTPFIASNDETLAWGRTAKKVQFMSVHCGSSRCLRLVHELRGRIPSPETSSTEGVPLP
jgi:hypothetical protein